MDIKALGKLRVIDLKNELDKRGLSKAGTKSVLIERLKEALTTEAVDTETEESQASNEVKEVEEDTVLWDNDETFEDVEGSVNKESVTIETTSKDDLVSNEDTAEDNVSTGVDEVVDGESESGGNAAEDEHEPQDDNKEVGDTNDSALLYDGGLEDILDYGDDEGKQDDLISFQIEESEALIMEEKTEEEPEGKEEEQEAGDKTEKKDDDKDVAADDKEGHPDINKMIWVCGLTKQTRALDLKTCFGIHGKVISAKVVMNPNAKEEKCFGLVTMSNEKEAAICIEKLNGFKLHNKDLIMSRPKKDNAVLRKMRQQQLAADKKQSSRPVGIRPRRISGESPADKERRTITGTTVSVNLKAEHRDHGSSSRSRNSPVRAPRHTSPRKRRTRSPPRRRRSRSPRRRSPSRRSPRRPSPRRRSPKKRSRSPRRSPRRRSPRRRSPRRSSPRRRSAEHSSSRRSPRRSSPRSTKRSRKSDEKVGSRERKGQNEAELRILREQTAKQEAAIKALMQGNMTNVGQLLGEKLTEKLAIDLKSALVKQLENTVKTMSSNKPSSAAIIEAQNASNAAKIKENIEKMKSNGQLTTKLVSSSSPSLAPYKPAASLPAFNPLLVSHNKQPEPYGPSDSHRSSSGSSSRTESRDSRHHSHRSHDSQSSRRSDTYSNARSDARAASSGGSNSANSQPSNKINDLLKSIQGVKDMVNKPSTYQQLPTQSYGGSQPPPQAYKTNPLMTPPPQYATPPFNNVPMNFTSQSMPPHPQLGWGAPPAPFIPHNTPQYRR